MSVTWIARCVGSEKPDLYAFVATWVILRVIGLFTPLRGTEHQEALGMDVVHHGEEAYATGEGAILVTPEGGVEDEVPIANPI